MNTVSARTDGLRETAGQGWLEAPLFRIGVSSLLSGLLMQRRQQLTGACSGPRCFPRGGSPAFRSGGDGLAALDRPHGLVELLGGGGQAEGKHGARVAAWHCRGAHIVPRETAIVHAGKGVAE